MRLKAWTLLLSGISYLIDKVDASTSKRYLDVPDSEIKQILGMTNNARRRYQGAFQPTASKMSAVTWNYQLEKDLRAFVLTTESAWFFWKNQTESRYNAQNLMAFEPFKSKYGSKLGFLIHDGCQSSSTGIKRIFYYRAIAQKDCFNYGHCNNFFTPRAGSINNYMSCNRYPYPAKLVSNTHCSWFWQYYPMLINDNVKEMACALLGQPGPNAAGGHRPNHFICYYLKVNPTAVQTTEIPYVQGVSCSECPSETKCVNKLCV